MNFAVLKVIAIVTVLSLLIVGGTYLYKQTLQKTPQKQPSSQVQTNSNQQVSSGSAVKNENIPSLPASPSASQTSNYVADVKTQAVAGQLLTFKGCIADPGVFKVKTGESFSIKNSDDKEVKISIAPNAIYTVGAGKTTVVKMEAEAAIYKYGCSQIGGVSAALSGILYVTK